MESPKHQLSMTVLMTPDTANFAGNVHGGTILKLLDQVAYACRHCCCMSLQLATSGEHARHARHARHAHRP